MNILIGLLAQAIAIYQLLIFIRVIMSWFMPYPTNPLAEFLYRITDPILDAARRAFPVLAQSGFDLSPILILFLLEFTKQFLFRLA